MKARSLKIKKKPTVLVAEDNVDHLELLSDALSVDNEVVGTDSRDDCMTLLEETQIDLVVLDYNLKKKFSGFDILKEIINRYPALPVIMVTAYGNEDLAVKVMKTGARDYIRKTLDNNYIERIVSNVKALVQANSKQKDVAHRDLIIEFIRAHKADFIVKWKKKLDDSLPASHPARSINFDNNKFELLLSAYLADIQNKNATETVRFFKEFLCINEYRPPFFYLLEILNTAFKEVAVAFIDQSVHVVDNYSSSVYYFIDLVVSENAIVIRDILYGRLGVNSPG